MMTQIYSMANYPRHGRLIDGFSDAIARLPDRENYHKFRENIGLAYNGNILREGSESQLFDVNEQPIAENILISCNYVQPDFMYFCKNKHQESAKTFKIAGCPDLIVEVWSKGNSQTERTALKNLYSSPTTEHWYLTQQSNKVECWLGRKKLKPQNLLNVLKTQSGLELDLRDLAI
ncbi:MAG: Uma2 family endonuclease [Turicibacter sp.]|nr:Uma2 family endonuclease [Turicibacter sp.]